MKVTLPRDEHSTLVKLIIGDPDADPQVMKLDDSHTEVEVPEGVRVEAHLCDASGRISEHHAPIVLVEPPKYQKKPEPIRVEQPSEESNSKE